MAGLADLVRSLSSVRSDAGACVSVYLDLDPSTVPHADALSSHVSALLADAREAAETWARDAAHDDTRTLREDLDRIASFLENDLDRTGAHGLALFVSGPHRLWRELRLPGSVDDAVHVGRSFVVAPVLPFLEHDREMILAAVGRDRGTIWRVERGDVDDVDDLSRDGQGQSDQGGWSQGRFQRARDVEAREHMRGVAEAIGELVPQGSDTLVVLACLEEQRPDFEEQLNSHVRDAVIGWLDYEAHADADDLLPEAERLLDEHVAHERDGLVERWREEHGQGSGRASRGWQETLAAAANAAVDTLLVDGTTGDAWECPSCGRGYVEPGECVLDSTALREVSGGALELAVRSTLESSGDVRFVLEGLDSGAVALLRFPLPASAVSDPRR